MYRLRNAVRFLNPEPVRYGAGEEFRWATEEEAEGIEIGYGCRVAVMGDGSRRLIELRDIETGEE